MTRFSHIQDHLDTNVPAWKFLGARLVKIEEGYSEVELPFRSELANSFGAVQGGLVTAVADAAGSIALSTKLPPGTVVVTLEIKMNYLNFSKGDIIARGRALKWGSRIGVSSIEVVTPDGSVSAVALATYTFKFPAPKPANKESV